jgi:trk system potassium uptake protein TrkH
MKMFRPAFAIFGMTLLLLAGLMLLPASLALVGPAPNSGIFLTTSLIAAVTGLLLTWTNRNTLQQLNTQKVYLITAVNWIGVIAVAAVPFIFSSLHLSVTDAMFEAVSGITTTGSTVITGLDNLPADILLWRSICQWIGGVGIVAMAVMILPFLRVGGMRLFKTESSDMSGKSTPRVKVQIRLLLQVYFMMTLLCVLCYWFFGMELFDAINHGMTTVATGGYSTYDASMGQFSSQHAILWTGVVFMTLGGIPFTLYVHMMINQKIFFPKDSQVRIFLQILFATGCIMTLYVWVTGSMSFVDALTHSFFNTVSIITTTGFASSDYSLWGPAAVAMFFFLTFVGGCSGSTSGGIKIFRFQLFWLYLKEQMIQSVHPNAVVTLEYNNRKVTEDIISSSISFMYMAMWSYAMLTVILALCGLDLVTSTTAALTALMNVGPGLGEIIGPAGNFSTLPDAAKWALSFGMLLGRLEYLTLYILLTPLFWRG